ncbi:MAG: S49 family peptidase [Gammaproteobacteria bacterium]|nr:S49 family peptidase [Gammaproteobacteria bacterium]
MIVFGAMFVFFIWIAFFSVAFFFVLHGLPTKVHEKPEKPYVALVRLNGFISTESAFSAEKVLPQLQAAFSDKEAKGVVIVINSGGGSPVQASIIQEKIVQLKKQYHKKVIVVGEDVLASGAYLVAMGADEVYVNPDTVTGSIGVIMEGFGFTDAIKKLGVSRRVYTAGDHKDRLDPFTPASDADKQKMMSILDEAHEHFIAIVTNARGSRLKGDPSVLFSGDFWLGSQAVKLGLVDGLGNQSDLVPHIFHVHQYVDYSEEPSIVDYLFKGLKSELDWNLSYHHHTLMARV